MKHIAGALAVIGGIGAVALLGGLAVFFLLNMPMLAMGLLIAGGGLLGALIITGAIIGAVKLFIHLNQPKSLIVEDAYLPEEELQQTQDNRPWEEVETRIVGGYDDNDDDQRQIRNVAKNAVEKTEKELLIEKKKEKNLLLHEFVTKCPLVADQFIGKVTKDDDLLLKSGVVFPLARTTPKKASEAEGVAEPSQRGIAIRA